MQAKNPGQHKLAMLRPWALDRRVTCQEGGGWARPGSRDRGRWERA